MLDDELSLIPVRDKQQGIYNAKTPYAEWKQFQNRRAGKDELFTEMDKKDTNAVAIITGRISDNLEVIDIDSKYKEGISAMLFDSIEKFYPDLYKQLRIHKTPSGGYHILYRLMDGKADGNKKLAKRYKTPEELKKEFDEGKKQPQKTIAFLETRGEGGYILAPPSMGYSVHNDVPIPYILSSDRDNLMNICKNFDEVVRESKVFKPKKDQDSAYTESPWDDYNNRCDFPALIESIGFKRTNDRVTKWMHFTRAGKESGISASINLEKNFFKVMTSSTDFDNSDGVTYSPVDVLCFSKFNKDKDKTFQWLRANGYGKMKPAVEKAIIKKAAISGNPIPKNLSENALKEYTALRTKMVELMPFGLFWSIDPEKETYRVNRRAFYDVAESMGYRLYRTSTLVKLDGNVIRRVEDSEFYQEMIDYIKEDNKNLYDDIFNAVDSFLQKSGKFAISRLTALDEGMILKDENKVAYKFFKNCYIKITENEIEAIEYDTLGDSLIWSDSIVNRMWIGEEPARNLYKEFLNNAIGYDSYCKKIIGYLAHDFKDESRNYVIVLTEKVPNPKDGGGSGKNIFGNLFRNTTTIKTVPGTQVKFDERFLQPWTFQKIYFLADIPKHIPWLFLKEQAGGTGLQKKLFVDQYEVQSEDMPKILINTNYSFAAEDGGVRRRIRALEFNEFYTLKGGVDVVHGKMFPKDFDAIDWQGFDWCIVESIQEFFKGNCKIEIVGLSDGGWRKKFDQDYGNHMYNFLEDVIDDWISAKKVSNEQIKNSYVEYMNSVDVPEKYRISFDKRIMAIDEFCDIKGLKSERYNKKVNGKSERGREFIENKDFVKEEVDGFEDLPPVIQVDDDEDSLPF